MLMHLPILQVIIPLMAAPTCLLLRVRGLVWWFVFLTSVLTTLVSVALLAQVLSDGPLIYTLGGWEAPWGIEYRIDLLNAPLLVLVAATSTVALMMARQSVASEIAEARQTYFYIAWLLSVAGLLGILATGDAFNVFVFLEISSLSAYTLIALGRDRRALWASYQYLIAGTIGATFILIGIGLMYSMTGTLNMADLAQRLPEVSSSRTVFTAFAFFTVGVCLKLALFPLHLWLPNAYTYAPSVVTAFLAATATKVAVYVLIRFIFTVFGFEFSFNHMPLQNILIALGIAGVFSASFMAIYQPNMKKLLAYSSVAQIGYIVLGLGFANETGLVATLVHLVNHGMMKGLLFVALAAIVYRIGSSEMVQIQGAGRQMPWTSAAIVLGGMSLIGIPLTTGFVSKWYLVSAALENGWWVVALLILLASLLAAIYVWKIVETLYFKPASAAMIKATEAPLGMLAPIYLLVAANIYFSLFTDYTVGVAQLASAALFGGAQ